MEIVKVTASKSYDVIIGHGTAALLSEKLRTLFGKVRICIVTDDNVAPLHLAAIQTHLYENGYPSEHFIFSNGENSKSPETLFALLEFLAEQRFSRKDVLLALGGGVTGDLTGLAAAMFMRGMHLIQMPTTLLSMVDSSVGGKTAVNLKNGKNLAGVFNQPELVLCDLHLLETLPDADFADGMAEVIKYGVIADRQLFDSVQNGEVSEALESIVARCISIKRDVVAEDEFDTGRRALLNFGHTLAHAIEKESGFSISHGSAVAMGMVLICDIADRNNFSGEKTLDAVKRAVENNHLSTKCPFPLSQLYRAATGDKKCSGGKISLILPKSIGDCYIQPMTLEQFKELLGA